MDRIAALNLAVATDLTIVVDADKNDLRKIAANLYKLVNIIDVRILSEQPHVSRDLALIKVRTEDAEARNNLARSRIAIRRTAGLGL